MITAFPSYRPNASAHLPPHRTAGVAPTHFARPETVIGAAARLPAHQDRAPAPIERKGAPASLARTSLPLTTSTPTKPSAPRNPTAASLAPSRPPQHSPSAPPRTAPQLPPRSQASPRADNAVRSNPYPRNAAPPQRPASVQPRNDQHADPRDKKPDHPITFQRFFKSVGPRTYAAQVKLASNGNHYFVLTEGQRDDTTGEIRKKRMNIFSEDFTAFFALLHETADHIRAHPVPEKVRQQQAKFWQRKNAKSPPPVRPH